MTDGGRLTTVARATVGGERLDLFLVRVSGASRKEVKRALDRGQVFVDGRPVRRAGHRLAGNETVSVSFPDSPVPPLPLEPAVLYRDHHLLALAKPPGLPSHPTVARGLNALEWTAELLRREGNPNPPILLHRLDAGTSGVLLFALSAGANRALAAAFACRKVEKTYLALVAGEPPENFSVNNFLRPGRRGKMAAVRAGGQPAETAFSVLARGPGFALVEARPRTGRTHQIRVHLSGEGFPLVGDTLYGGPTAVRVAVRVLHARRHLLHAWKLAFQCPATSERKTVKSPLPDDYKPFLHHLTIPLPRGIEVP